MHDRYSHTTTVQRFHSSLVRVAVSRHSIEATRCMLERSRKSIEQSARKLRESQKLATHPLFRRWIRTLQQQES